MLAIGRFTTIEEATRAVIAPWEYNLKDDAGDDLVAYLKAASKPKISKQKRTIIISSLQPTDAKAPASNHRIAERLLVPRRDEAELHARGESWEHRHPIQRSDTFEEAP